jgi:hypothetical protein
MYISYVHTYIQDVAGGNVNILEGLLTKNGMSTCVLFRTVSSVEIFHSTSAKLLIKRYYVLFIMSVFIVQLTKLVHCN